MANISNITNKTLTTVSANLDGVEFDNIPNSKQVAPNTQTQGISDNPWNINGEGSWKGAVNAVDIDWNGAKLGSSTINTTGELLSYISNKVGSGSSSNPPDSIHITFS